MESDDLMPSDGTFLGGVPREPLDQVVERQHEQAQTLQGLDEIKRVIAHFEERIAYRDSLESINVNLADDPLLHQKKCEVNELLKMALVEEKQMLEELVAIYVKNK